MALQPGTSVKIAVRMKREAQKKFATTPGTRDVLPTESTRLLDVQSKVMERLGMYGFREILKKGIEY